MLDTETRPGHSDMMMSYMYNPHMISSALDDGDHKHDNSSESLTHHDKSPASSPGIFSCETKKSSDRLKLEASADEEFIHV